MPNGKKRHLIKQQIDLKNLDREKQYLWMDVFDIDLPEYPGNPNAEEKRKPGLLNLAGWPLEKRLSGELAAQVGRLKADIEAFKKAMTPEPPYAYGIGEAKEPTTLKVFVRGDVYTFGEEAPRAFLSIFGDAEPRRFEKGSGRLELAEAILTQPVSSRVVVNRIWRWHMGSGLVETPNNFGMVGERPTNPDLLDFLGVKFQEGGMSWKKLHKQILMSKTYQLSAVNVDANATKDPANRLYWRANRRRLDAEGIWDALLTASGKLDTSQLGGPSEDIGNLKMTRRGVYGKVSRMYPNQFLTTFDAPAASISNEFRYMTNVPQQRLFFLNNELVRKQAELLAERLKPAGENEAQVKKAYELVYQRRPSPAELAFALDFLKKAEAELATSTATPAATPAAAAKPMVAGMAAKPEAADGMGAPAEEAKAEKPVKLAPIESLCWGLLSSNEFMYLN
jgi:hypothetical protein